MKQIALCIPTYERCECVQDLLDNCVSYYLEYGIDIFLFDSSRTDLVEKFAAQEEKKYPGRLHYIKVPSELHTAEKTLDIYAGKGFPLKRYDYLWICSDALQFTRSAMEKISAVWEGDVDVIAIDPRDIDSIGSREYSNVNEFFGDCCWGMSLLGASILNVKTMLLDLTWEDRDEYLQEKIIDFAHLSFIFHHILRRFDFKGYHVSLQNREYRSSAYKKVSGWHSMIFYIICESWVETIKSLPDIYLNKEAAIFRGGKYSLGTSRRFQELRMEGIYNFKIFFKYISVWSKVCSINKWHLFAIALMPEAWLWRQYESTKKKLLGEFRAFREKHRQIFLYGAGRVGTVFAIYFQREHVEFDGFCVSNALEDMSHLGRPVYTISALNITPEMGIVIALQEENAQDILHLLKDRKVPDEHIFYSQDFYKLISYELGYRD